MRCLIVFFVLIIQLLEATSKEGARNSNQSPIAYQELAERFSKIKVISDAAIGLYPRSFFQGTIDTQGQVFGILRNFSWIRSWYDSKGSKPEFIEIVNNDHTFTPVAKDRSEDDDTNKFNTRFVVQGTVRGTISNFNCQFFVKGHKDIFEEFDILSMLWESEKYRGVTSIASISGNIQPKNPPQGACPRNDVLYNFLKNTGLYSSDINKIKKILGLFDMSVIQALPKKVTKDNIVTYSSYIKLLVLNCMTFFLQNITNMNQFTIDENLLNEFGESNFSTELENYFQEYIDKKLKQSNKKPNEELQSKFKEELRQKLKNTIYQSKMFILFCAQKQIGLNLLNAYKTQVESLIERWQKNDFQFIEILPKSLDINSLVQFSNYIATQVKTLTSRLLDLSNRPKPGNLEQARTYLATHVLGKPESVDQFTPKKQLLTEFEESYFSSELEKYYNENKIIDKQKSKKIKTIDKSKQFILFCVKKYVPNLFEGNWAKDRIISFIEEELKLSQSD